MTLDRISNVHVLRPKLGEFVAYNALHFEASQNAVSSTYETNHVSHFTWCDNVAGAVGTSIEGSNLFCDENHKVSVDGSDAIYYALSTEEWTYLLSNHVSNDDGGVREDAYSVRLVIDCE